MDKCEVVEEVILCTGFCAVTDGGVLAVGRARGTEFLVGSVVVLAGSVASAAGSVSGEALSRVEESAVAVDYLRAARGLAVIEALRAFDTVHISGYENVLEDAEAEDFLSPSVGLVCTDSAAVFSFSSGGVNTFLGVCGIGTARDWTVSNEVSTLVDSGFVVDYIDGAPFVGVADSSEVSSNVVGVLHTHMGVYEAVSAGSLVRGASSLTVIDTGEGLDSFCASLLVTLRDSALAQSRALITSVFSTEVTEEIIARDLVEGGAPFLVHTPAHSETSIETTLYGQGLITTVAAVEGSLVVEELVRGPLVQSRGVAEDYMRASTTLLLVEGVKAGATILPSVETSVGSFAEATGENSTYVVLSPMVLELANSTVEVEISYGVSESDATFVLAVGKGRAFDRVEVLSGLDGVAWVLNSKSLAHSYYDNFVPFNSAVQVGDRVFMLSSDGLYELGGESNDGTPIEAEVTTGLWDFGTIERKRVEQYDLGYTSTGGLAAVVACEGFLESAPQVLEARDMHTAHTSRIRVGKGMVGRYWRLSLRNMEGSDFELFSLQAKIAQSVRRMR